MRIGIYGGSFNPIHKGHINVALESLKALSLDKLIVVPTNISPHKDNIGFASANDRLNMCKLVFSGFEKVEVSDRETVRPGISFTIDTLKEIKNAYKNSRNFLIVGTDMFLCFEKWKNFKDILKIVTLCVVPRNVADTYKINSYVKKLKFFEATIKVLNINILQISSTEIRKKLEKSDDVTNFLPLEVIKYIKENKLYKVGSETNF